MLTLEYRCIPAVGGGVLVSRTLPNHQIKFKRITCYKLLAFPFAPKSGSGVANLFEKAWFKLEMLFQKDYSAKIKMHQFSENSSDQ